MATLLERHAPYVPVLLVGRLADTATTLYGLTIAGVYERNVVVASLIESFGPGGGLTVANLCSIAAVVIVVEAGVAARRRRRRKAVALADGGSASTDGGAGGTRSGPSADGGVLTERLVVELGYLPSVALSFGAAAWNVGVLAAA